ncbi:MAG: hypothetical protein IJJ38_04840 [Lachnospiraceae bacterium]|nr:hypothetical protein [Lachnospiraceae bacterium]
MNRMRVTALILTTAMALSACGSGNAGAASGSAAESAAEASVPAAAESAAEVSVPAAAESAAEVSVPAAAESAAEVSVPAAADSGAESLSAEAGSPEEESLSEKSENSSGFAVNKEADLAFHRKIDRMVDLAQNGREVSLICSRLGAERAEGETVQKEMILTILTTMGVMEIGEESDDVETEVGDVFTLRVDGTSESISFGRRRLIKDDGSCSYYVNPSSSRAFWHLVGEFLSAEGQQ